jgi:hypothetical protein
MEAVLLSQLERRGKALEHVVACSLKHVYNWSLVVENYPFTFERQKTSRSDHRPKVDLKEIDVLAINRRGDNVDRSQVLAPHTRDEVLEVNVKDWLTSSLGPNETWDIEQAFKTCEPKIIENFPKSRIRRLFVSYDLTEPGLKYLLGRSPRIDVLCRLDKRGFQSFKTSHKGRVGSLEDELLKPTLDKIRGYFDKKVYPSWGSLGMDILRIYEYFKPLR